MPTGPVVRSTFTRTLMGPRSSSLRDLVLSRRDGWPHCFASSNGCLTENRKKDKHPWTLIATPRYQCFSTFLVFIPIALTTHE